MADAGDDSMAKRTCWTCALGKRGCDGEWPCGRCAKLGKVATCKQAPAGYKRVLRIIKEDGLAPGEGEDMVVFCERMSHSSAMQGGRKRRVAECSADVSEEPKPTGHRVAPHDSPPSGSTLSLPVFVHVWQAAGGALQGADELLKAISAHACGEQRLTTNPTAFLGPGCSYANGVSPIVRIPEDYLRLYAALGVSPAGRAGDGSAPARIRLDAKAGCLPLVTTDLPYSVLDTFAEAALLCDPTPAIRFVYPQGGLFMPSSALFNTAALELLGTCAGEAAAWVSLAKEPPFLHHAYALPRMLLSLHAASSGMIQTAFRGVYVQRSGEGRHCTPPACAVDPLDPKVSYRPFAATELVRYEHYPDGSVRTQTVYWLDIRWPGEGVKAVMVAGEPYPAPSIGGTGIEAAAGGTQTCPDDFIIDLSLLQGSTKLLISCPGEFSEVRTITAAVQGRQGAGGKGGEQAGDSRVEDLPAATALATSLTPAIMSCAPVGMSPAQHGAWPSGACWVLPAITPLTLEQARGLLAQAEGMLRMEGRSIAELESELQQSLIQQRVVNDNAHLVRGSTAGSSASSDPLSSLSATGLGSSSALANLAATAWSSSSAPAPAPGAAALRSCCTSARLHFSAHGVELHCSTGLKLRLSSCTAPVFSWLAIDRYEAAVALDVLAHAALQAATGHAAARSVSVTGDGRDAWPPQATVRLTTDASTGGVLVLLDVPAGPLLRPPCKPAPATHLTWLVLSGSTAHDVERGPFAPSQGGSLAGLEQGQVPARVPAHLPGGFSLYGGKQLVGVARSESSHDVALNVATLVMKQLGITGEHGPRPPARLSIRAKKHGAQDGQGNGGQGEEEPGAGDMSAFPFPAHHAAPSPAPPDLLHIDYGRIPMASAGPSPSSAVLSMGRTGLTRAAYGSYPAVHAHSYAAVVAAGRGGRPGAGVVPPGPGGRLLLPGLDHLLGHEPDAVGPGSMIAGHGQSDAHVQGGRMGLHAGAQGGVPPGVLYGAGSLPPTTASHLHGHGHGVGVREHGGKGMMPRGPQGRAVRGRRSGGLEVGGGGGLSSGGSSPMHGSAVGDEDRGSYVGGHHHGGGTGGEPSLGLSMDPTPIVTASSVGGRGGPGGGGGVQGTGSGLYTLAYGGGGGGGRGRAMGGGGGGMAETENGTPAILHGITPSATGTSGGMHGMSMVWGGGGGGAVHSGGQGGGGGGPASHLAMGGAQGGAGGVGGLVGAGDLGFSPGPLGRSASISPDAAAGLRGRERESSPYDGAQTQLALGGGQQAWNTSTGGYPLPSVRVSHTGRVFEGYVAGGM